MQMDKEQTAQQDVVDLKPEWQVKLLRLEEQWPLVFPRCSNIMLRNPFDFMCLYYFCLKHNTAKMCLSVDQFGGDTVRKIEILLSMVYTDKIALIYVNVGETEQPWTTTC